MTGARRLALLCLGVMVAVACSLGFGAARAWATDITVTNTSQLESAVATSSSGDRILMTPGSNAYAPIHTLTIAAGKTLTIQPTGAPGQVLILGSAVVDFPADLFKVNGNLILNNVTLAQTAPEGFAVNDFGQSTFTGVTIAANSGVSFDAEPGSSATLTNSTIST